MLLKTNAGGATAGDTAEQYPPLSTKLLVGVGLFLAVFLVGLDQTIVATALPKISDHFNSLNDVGWYASAFFLTMYLPQLPSIARALAVLVLIAGPLYSRHLANFIKFST
jgi:MFS family permease